MANEKAVEKILKLGQKGKTKKLISYASSKKQDERAAAAEALGYTTGDDPYNALIILLRDPVAAVGIKAAGSLKKMGKQTAVEHLRHVSLHTSDESLKAACNEAAASLASTGR